MGNIDSIENANYDNTNNRNDSNDNAQLDIAAEEIQEVARMYLNSKINSNIQINKLKNKIQDILFEEKECIPDGVYLKLMNAIKY